MKAPLRLIPLILILFTLFTCTQKNESRVRVQSTRPGATDNVVYRSDPGIVITVSWKYPRSQKGSAILYQGNGAVAWGTAFPNSDNTVSTDSTDVMYYNFVSWDTPGSWRLVMGFEGEDSIDYFFNVEPPQVTAAPLSNTYQALPCTAGDGSILLANFYQFTPLQNESMRTYGIQWNWSEVIDAVKNRVVQCGAHEITGESLENWEKYLEQLSGKKIRQQQPSVHERIAAVMPVYEEEFLFVNPAVVKWFAETMVPDPGASAMFGWTFQALYDANLRDIARTMALTYMYYNSLPNDGLDAQVQFAEMAARKYVNKEEERVMERNDYPPQYTLMMEWHDEPARAWVASQLPSSAVGENGYSLVPNQLGFWLRRGIDGSVNEVWAAMRGVMLKYDESWVKNYVDGEWKM